MKPLQNPKQKQLNSNYLKYDDLRKFTEVIFYLKIKPQTRLSPRFFIVLIKYSKIVF